MVNGGKFVGEQIIELCLSLVIVVHNFAKDKRKLLKFFWLYKVNEWHI